MDGGTLTTIKEVLGQRNLEVQIEVLGMVEEQICQQQVDTGLKINRTILINQLHAQKLLSLPSQMTYLDCHSGVE